MKFPHIVRNSRATPSAITDDVVGINMIIIQKNQSTTTKFEIFPDYRRDIG